jgi:hypothetical protein
MKKMKQTPNAKRSTPNAEFRKILSSTLSVGRWALDVFCQDCHDTDTSTLPHRFRGLCFLSACLLH